MLRDVRKFQFLEQLTFFQHYTLRSCYHNSWDKNVEVHNIWHVKKETKRYGNPNEVLTIDSFIPILASSSISFLSDMRIPIPILLFIWVSASCLLPKMIKTNLSEHKKLRKIRTNHEELIKDRKRESMSCSHRQTCISGVRVTCWFIPDCAASTVETLKRLTASITSTSVATWDLKPYIKEWQINYLKKLD